MVFLDNTSRLNQFICRIQIISEGKKRKLVIKNCKLDDAGMITAKTNSDEVSAPLEVKRKYIASKVKVDTWVKNENSSLGGNDKFRLMGWTGGGEEGLWEIYKIFYLLFIFH